MRIAVVGAGGILGRAICQVLMAQGYTVTSITKTSIVSEISLSAQIATGEDDALKHVSSRGPWDCVIDLRAFNPNDLTAIEEAFSQAKHWIYFSTMYVYRTFSPIDLAYRTFDPPLAEEHVCQPHGTYGAGKYACERLLCELSSNASRLSILRLPFVIGQWDRSLRVHQYIQQIENESTIVLPAAGKHRVEIIFAEDVAKRVVELLTLNTFSPLITNIVGGPCLQLKEHLAIAANVLGYPLHIEGRENPTDIVRQPYAFPYDIELSRERFHAVFGPQVESSNWGYAWKTAILSEKQIANTKFN
jgi:nucleoside-diphosphate-sugar epimerase